MHQRYPLFIAGSIISMMAIISLANKFALVHSHTEPIFRFSLIGLYIILFFSMIYKEFSEDIRKNKNYLRLSIELLLPVLLLSTFSHKLVTNYISGIFVALTFLYFLRNRALTPPNRIYTALFIYAAFIVLGTIGTVKGFHIPEVILVFYFIPLAFIFYDFSQKTLLKSAKIFFRGTLLYMTFCVIYWWFNYQYLDTSFLTWVSSKLFFNPDMLFWQEQTKFVNGSDHYQAFMFANAWFYYFHPSFIAMPLFFGIAVGFYLNYKKPEGIRVTKLELVIYNLLVFLVLALMQSRVGIVGFIFTLSISALYYSKLKLHMLKITLLAYLVFGSFIFLTLDDEIDSFVYDNIRKTNYTLAVNYVKDHLWWGTGSFEQNLALEEQEELMRETLPPLGIKKTYTHNQFIGHMVQYGVWGLLILLYLVITILLFSIRERSYLLQMFLAIIVLMMMIEEPLYRQVGISVSVVFLVFFTAISDSKKDNRKIILKSINSER